jgi:ribonuclease HII
VFERLIAGLEADRYIVDGRLKLETHEKAPRVQVKVRADQTVETVSAASIVAKLNRDWMMEALHRGFPVYRWDHNKGYGTREHIAALRKYGPCRLHRRQFVETALSMQIPLWPPPEQSPVEE